MAGGLFYKGSEGMADKCIGNLTLNTKGVEEAVKRVNEMLGDLGVGKKVNISSRVTAAVRESLKDIENLIGQSEKRITEITNKAVASIEKLGKTKADDEKSKQSIQSALALYEKLYNAKAKLYELDQKGQKDSVAYAKAAADVEKYERALGNLTNKIKKAAQETKEYEAIITKTVNVQNAAKATAESKEVEKATQAYIKLLEAKSKVKQFEAEGKEGTEEYIKATQNAGKAYDAFILYSKGAREAAQASKEAAQARKDLNEVEQNISTQNPYQTDWLAEAKQKYIELTDAIKKYNAERDAKNNLGMATEQAKIDKIMEEVGVIQQIVNASDMEASKKQQILNIVNQCTTAEMQHNNVVKGNVQVTGELESQVKSLVTRYLSLVAVIRTINSLIQNMVEYVSEYSDKMNEIQMITMKSNEEVAKLAETYRQIAADMNVSSLDMADAAIYFTRQGLEAEEIEKRLVNVTRYAKAANVEFKDASEIITAVVNSMNLVEEEAEDGRNAAQRVADVFLNIGDNAATSGQEIGEAMQKAAASAGAFGVSMEWLASYIATVSETTRQEARTIGTAFNTIIARLHQIKQTGYNQEDETKVNDIAKALSKIDVVLMDQEGNWRDMEDILEEIAAEWDKLDGKTKSYIATTMAGVKQQNVFLALMNDMSKGIEGQSRAYELHELAVNSDGVAEQKYAVYLDNVTAAQERLTIAQENFYAILNQDIIKNWYNALAGIVNWITDATEKMGGLNLIIPVVTGAVGLLTVAIVKLAAAASAAGGALALLGAHPVIIAISAVAVGIAALTTAGSLFVDTAKEMEERFNAANEILTESRSRISTYTSDQERLKDMIADVGEETPMTSEKIKEYNGLLEDLKKVSPEAATAVDNLRAGFISQKEAAEILNNEIEEVIRKEQKLSTMSLITKYSNWAGNDNSGQTGFMSRMASWGPAYQNSGSDKSIFAEGLQYYYEHDVLPRIKQGFAIDEQGTPYLTKEVIDEIESQLDDFKAIGMETDWGVIGDIIWSKFVGSSTENVADAIKEQADAAIDDVMKTLGATLNDVEYGTLRKQLVEAVFGDDMKLSAQEYKAMGANIVKFLSEIMRNGFNFDEVDAMSSIEYIGKEILGNYFYILFEDQLEAIKTDPNLKDIASGISEAISELMEEGFTNPEIASLLEETNLNEWVYAVERMKQKLLDEIKSRAGVDNLGSVILDMSTGEESFDTGMWEDLDASLLKYIRDLLKAGVAYADIQLAMDMSGGSVDTFKEKLVELTGVDIEEDSEEKVKSLKDLVKEIDASIKDIRSLDSAIKSIQEDKNNINYGDILGLAEAHPELLTVIGDTNALLEALKKIRAEASNDQRASIKEIILGNEKAMSGSKYAGTGYATLGEYRSTLVGAELEAFDAEIEKMVTGWQKANEDAKKIAKETAKEVKETEKTFSDTVKEVEKIDKMIEKLDKNKKVDFSDLIDLSTAHPELMAFASDTDTLIRKLQELKAAASGDVKNKLYNTLLDSEEYYKNSKHYDSRFKTMRELIEDIHQSRGDAQTINNEVRQAAQDIIDAAEATGEAVELTLDEQSKAINAYIKDIRALDSAIKDVQENKDDFNYADILSLAEAHPELLTVINDTDKLIQKLKEIREESSNKQRQSIKSMILDDAGAMAGSSYAGKGYETLGKYRDSLTGDALTEFDAYIEKLVDNWQKANEDVKKTTKETANAAKEAKKTFNETIQEVERLDNVIKKLQSGKDIDFSDIINLSTAHPEIVAFANDADKLLEILQRLKKEAKADTKGAVASVMMDDEEFYKESKYYDSRFKTMREYIVMLQDTGGNWQEVATYVSQSAEDIVNAAETTESAAESWLEAQYKLAEINEQVSWARSNHFSEQINMLQGAIEQGGIEQAIAIFDTWDEKMQQAVGSEYPAFIKAMGSAKEAMRKQGDQAADTTKQTNDLINALNRAEKLNSVKHFTDTAKAIKQLDEGTISATDAYAVYTKEINKVSKAYEDILDVQNKMAYNAKEVNKDNQQSIDVSDVNNLASLLNMTTDEILADFPAAVDMFDSLIGKTGELQSVLDLLNASAFIRITGTSEADFTNIQNGLISTQNMAKETIDMLIATGQWALDTIELNTDAWVQNPDGSWSTQRLTGTQQILKPTGNNPFSKQSSVVPKSDTKQSSNRNGSSSGSGSGSRNNNNKNQMTEVEKMLDMMSQVDAIQEYQQSFYQSQQKYYEQTGYLQGVIGYMQLEKETLDAQNKTLDGNIKRIEEYIDKKRAELNSLSTSDERYEEVADDLDKLQKAHQTYTKQVVDNKTAIDQLNKSMDDQRKQIRQMEINLRNTILKAIEDREKKTKDMLNAEVQMENKVFDIIKKRYEKERDEIIETTNLKIDSLKNESKLLSEQLQLRKKQAEEENKYKKLQEYERQYQRIIADPTRAKEAREIQKEISSLREEMAWDAAEKEVEAQQKSIDQQVSSLEDYIDYIKNYYQEMFDNPKKLISEMQDIMSMSSKEIVEWLKNNDDEYLKSSDNMRETLISSWEDTLMTMEGEIRTYWDEVEDIISQGDEAIIEFLKENSADYAAAGKLQAEAYVEEWQEQLDNLRKATTPIEQEVVTTYTTIVKNQTINSGSSGGGSRSSGSSANVNKTEEVQEEVQAAPQLKTYYYNTLDPKKLYSSPANATKQAGKYLSDARAAGDTESVDAWTYQNQILSMDLASIPQGYKFMYKKGGMADYTGPAWVDGSPQDPERILSPYQTKLFESMVQALERMSMINISSMPNYGNAVAAGGNPVSVGDIVVNVENLDTDDDYEELAEKVSSVLMERIGRTSVVGGLRIGSI